MVAYAHLTLSCMKVELLNIGHWDFVPFSEVLLKALQSARGIDMINQLLFWTANSVKRGWISPLVLELARSVHEINLLSRFDYDEIGTLLKVFEYRNKEMEFQNLQTDGRIPRGDPSSSTIELFRPKSSEIFRNLPPTSSNDDTIVHIEYRAHLFLRSFTQ
jgi:hypothetical protein